MNIYHEEIAPLQENAYAEWYEEVRYHAVNLALKNGSVTSDDLWEVCPPPPGVNTKAMGAIFRGKHWKKIGYTLTKRGTSHSRPIGIWALKNA